MTHFAEICVNSVSGMVLFARPGYKHNRLTYTTHCTHLPSVSEVRWLPKASPEPPLWAGTRRTYSIQKILVLLQKARKREKARKCDQFTNAVAWISATGGYRWVLHSQTSGNLLVVAMIRLLIQLFSFHQPSSVPTELWGHISFRSHSQAQPLVLMPRTVPGGPWLQKNSWGSLPHEAWFNPHGTCPAIGPAHDIPAGHLPTARKGERQMLLSNKYTRACFAHLHLHLHTS